MKIQIDIKTCQECPFIKIERCYTADSWEHANDWFCKKKDNKKIEGYIGWNEERDVEIPKWCPIAVKKKVTK